MVQPVDPLDFRSAISDKDGRPTVFFLRQWQNLIKLVASLREIIESVADLDGRAINTTAPLAGGGTLSADLTLSLSDTAVTPNTYGVRKIAQFTVDAKGRLTAAADGGGFTVATLPAGTVGERSYVTDATAPTWLLAVAGTGGGAVVAPVFRNASAWVYG